jgi:hypothetical protein
LKLDERIKPCKTLDQVNQSTAVQLKTNGGNIESNTKTSNRREDEMQIDRTAPGPETKQKSAFRIKIGTITSESTSFPTIGTKLFSRS